MVEVIVKIFRLLFLTETDLKSFIMYCNKVRQWNKQIVVEHYRSVFHNNYEIIRLIYKDLNDSEVFCFQTNWSLAQVFKSYYTYISIISI